MVTSYGGRRKSTLERILTRDVGFNKAHTTFHKNGAITIHWTERMLDDGDVSGSLETKLLDAFTDLVILESGPGPLPHRGQVVKCIFDDADPSIVATGWRVRPARAVAFATESKPEKEIVLVDPDSVELDGDIYSDEIIDAFLELRQWQSAGYTRAHVIRELKAQIARDLDEKQREQAK